VLETASADLQVQGQRGLGLHLFQELDGISPGGLALNGLIAPVLDPNDVFSLKPLKIILQIGNEGGRVLAGLVDHLEQVFGHSLIVKGQSVDQSLNVVCLLVHGLEVGQGDVSFTVQLALCLLHGLVEGVPFGLRVGLGGGVVAGLDALLQARHAPH
jgi:hypothetical protein